MKDTRETLTRNLDLPRIEANNEFKKDIPEEHRPQPRFKVGDKLVAAYALDKPFTLNNEPLWDYEFMGWLVSPGLIGVHESNFIYAKEIKQWTPHEDGLWSYWTKDKGGEPGA